jgi:IstB-like ATP binding protein
LVKELPMNDILVTALKRLRLSGLLASLEVRLQEASSHALNHAEFLELVLQDELLVRSNRLFKRRVKAAGFREQNLRQSLEDDFRKIDAEALREGTFWRADLRNMDANMKAYSSRPV